MRFRSFIPVAAAAAVLAGCSTDSAITESAVSARTVAQPTEAESAVVSAELAAMNEQLALSGSAMRVLKAELLVDAKTWSGASQTLIADDRQRGTGYRWVKGDPRRAGRTGVTYAFDPRNSNTITRNIDGSGVRLVTAAEFDAYLEEGTAAWRDRSCSSAPVDRVAVPAGIDPDLLDNLFLGSDGGRPYAQVSDIVQAGWKPLSFFQAFAGADGAGILGVSFTFIFTNLDGTPTDIDGDGNADTGLNEVYYNTAYYWAGHGGSNAVDFYSIIAHETGHSFGLNHFGKVFVTKRDAADGISIADVKYAPKALMNAVYVTGRSEILGSDNSSFCQIWASK
ncbi:MAG: hypothetical protein V4813_10450 [Gemmatimonadota bacterium]